MTNSSHRLFTTVSNHKLALAACGLGAHASAATAYGGQSTPPEDPNGHHQSKVSTDSLSQRDAAAKITWWTQGQERFNENKQVFDEGLKHNHQYIHQSTSSMFLPQKVSCDEQHDHQLTYLVSGNNKNNKTNGAGNFTASSTMGMNPAAATTKPIKHKTQVSEIANKWDNPEWLECLEKNDKLMSALAEMNDDIETIASLLGKAEMKSIQEKGKVLSESIKTTEDFEVVVQLCKDSIRRIQANIRESETNKLEIVRDLTILKMKMKELVYWLHIHEEKEKFKWEEGRERLEKNKKLFDEERKRMKALAASTRPNLALPRAP